MNIPETPVDATYNWWGSERPAYISGKIWDGRDNDSLVEVEFQPYRVSNVSLINGKAVNQENPSTISFNLNIFLLCTRHNKD